MGGLTHNLNGAILPVIFRENNKYSVQIQMLSHICNLEELVTLFWFFILLSSKVEGGKTKEKNEDVPTKSQFMEV